MENGKLGCTVCGNVRNINVLSSQGIRLSTEWREGKVGAFGSTRAQQQAALRKKVMDHRLSQAHKKAAALTAVAQDNAIQNAVAAQLSEHYEATCVFRTVYNQAKLGRPFTDLQSNTDLQRLNGLNMGHILHSNISSANITVHISNEMCKQFVLHIVENGSPIAVLVDESTTLS